MVIFPELIFPKIYSTEESEKTIIKHYVLQSTAVKSCKPTILLKMNSLPVLSKDFTYILISLSLLFCFYNFQNRFFEKQLSMAAPFIDTTYTNKTSFINTGPSSPDRLKKVSKINVVKKVSYIQIPLFFVDSVIYFLMPSEADLRLLQHPRWSSLW